MMLRNLLLLAAVCGSACSAGASVRLHGRLGSILDRMIERHVAGMDVDYITAPFQEKTERRRWWQTEFWGKWMHSAAPYQAYSGSERIRSLMERGIDRILGSQEADGYIGNYPDELRCGEGWDVWGMKYTMLGLLHYYDWTRTGTPAEKENGARALAACRRLCDYVIRELGPGGRRGVELWQTGNWSGYASSSILEPVVWLYRRTQDRRYLDFAAYVVKGMTEPAAGPRLVDLALKGISVADRNGHGNPADASGGYVLKHNRWKAYEMMSCYQGMLDYVQVRSEESGAKGHGEDPLFRAAMMAAEDIVREEINLAGGCTSGEAWFHGAKKQHLPYEHQQETCVTTTWMRLCLKLLELTGDPKWADQIERTFYNAYLAAMKSDASEFAGYTPLTGCRTHGQHHCFMHTDCCTANGPRGFLCFLDGLFKVEADAAVLNFYASASLSGKTPGTGKKVAFDMYAIYPRENFVRIVSHTENVGSLTLKLRIPCWSAKTTVAVNGEPQPDVRAGAYYALAREWKLGDVVEVRFDMPVVAHKYGHNIAFTRGPVLLARDSRFADGDMNEPYRKGLRDGQVMTTFSPVRSMSDAIWMQFSATLPIGCHHENPEGRNGRTVFFCDFASAGNTWNRDDHYQTWFMDEYHAIE